MYVPGALALDESGCSTAALCAVINSYRPRDTTVRVVHVIEWPRVLPTSFMFTEGPAAADRVMAAHDEIRRRGGDLVARAVARLTQAHFAATAHVIEGDPREEILAMAAALACGRYRDGVAWPQSDESAAPWQRIGGCRAACHMLGAGRSGTCVRPRRSLPDGFVTTISRHGESRPRLTTNWR